jgi:hypothetical protein
LSDQGKDGKIALNQISWKTFLASDISVNISMTNICGECDNFGSFYQENSPTMSKLFATVIRYVELEQCFAPMEPVKSTAVITYLIFGAWCTGDG